MCQQKLGQNSVAGEELDAGAGGAGADEVAACEASVDAVYAACDAEQPGAPRLCLYEAYRPLCKTGRTDVVKAIFDCLKLDACQTPSDPSDAGSTDDLDGIVADIMLMSSSDERAFTTCEPGACGTTDCVDASPLGPADQCPDL
jgi:hypothetical protein